MMRKTPSAEPGERNHGVTMNASSSSVSTGRPWRIVAAAALRLAALYAVGVAILSAALNRVGPPDETLTIVGTEGAIMLALAFVALLAARRRSLYVVWTLLLLLWTMGLVSRTMPLSDVRPFGIPPLFASWTVLAMPLAVMGAVAEPASPSGHRRHRAIVWLALAVWLLLAFLGRHYEYMTWDVWVPNAPYHAVFVAVWCVWVPAPFALAAWSIRAWHRTARSEVSTASATPRAR